MKLVTTTDNLEKRFGMKKAIDILCDAGYDALDFSAFYPRLYTDELGDAFFLEMKKYALDKGLTFEQAHAPFASSFRDDEEKTKQRFGEIVRSMKNASLLGVKRIVVHPCQHLMHHEANNAELLFEMNMDFYKRLIPFAEEYGIKIAVENMWQTVGVHRYSIGTPVIYRSVCSSPDEFLRYLDELNSDAFCACLDIGHTMLVREKPENFIKALGSRYLECLHVHDVDGIVDDHTLPFYGITDWDSVLKTLAEIGYKGNLTFEADNFMVNLPDALCPSAAKFMADTGRYLVGNFEKYNK
ncbi:MAG: sugar phosphate isomerase/epimerase [Ruminococcaceae bacterium]|nr:sugar phosphate isomerase/epimerase [Oscillospiraceae bacterium]